MLHGNGAANSIWQRNGRRFGPRVGHGAANAMRRRNGPRRGPVTGQITRPRFASSSSSCALFYFFLVFLSFRCRRRTLCLIMITMTVIASIYTLFFCLEEEVFDGLTKKKKIGPFGEWAVFAFASTWRLHHHSTCSPQFFGFFFLSFFLSFYYCFFSFFCP